LVATGFASSIPLVKAPFSLFLALRYLKPKRTFVSVITCIAVLGVTLGIMVPVVVRAVMTGFERSLQRVILGFEPHIRVIGGDYIQNWREILPGLERTPGVIGAAPYVMGAVLVERSDETQHNTRTVQAVIRGINVAQEQQLIDLKKFVTGTIEMNSDEVIIGRTLAADLGVDIGDEVTIYAPGNISGLIQAIREDTDNPNAKPRTLKDLKADGGIVIPAPMKVVGLFNSGSNGFDATYILMPLHNAQELYMLKDKVHGIAVKTNDPYHVEKIQQAIDDEFQGRIGTISWFDENRARFDAITMERNTMFIILFFITLVAAFGVMSTLITITVQKTREIGIMKTLGATLGQIVWVFLFQGMVVALIGTIAGLGSALLLLAYRNDFRAWLSEVLHKEIFPSSIYDLDGIPAEIVPSDIAVICVSAFIICSLGALIPSLLAALQDPVKALRHE
jgi:lipoprotein-releasing system permease protein